MSHFLSFPLIIIGLFIGSLLSSKASYAQSKDDKRNKRVKVIYRSHTDVDLSGSAVQGKVRAPEVFYIFQRKRGDNHDVINAPNNLDHLKGDTVVQLRRLVKDG